MKSFRKGLGIIKPSAPRKERRMDGERSHGRSRWLRGAVRPGGVGERAELAKCLLQKLGHIS